MAVEPRKRRVMIDDETGTPIDATNPLPVSATLVVGDIEIGAVEIKDGTTDTRQKVKTDGTDNASVVMQNTQPLPTGASTAVKQLANDHDVNVSNMIPAVETGLATSAKQDTIATALGVVYGTRIDEASATVTYIGKAATGSATSGALWQVQKIDTTTGTVITWADGNGDFDNIWDNRASLSYS